MYRKYRAYRECYTLGGTFRPFERSKYVSIVQKMTKSPLGIKCWVYYVIEHFLYDKKRVIKRIMNTEMDDVVRRKQLHKKLDAVVEFLKFEYNSQLNADEEVAHHPEYYALHMMMTLLTSNGILEYSNVNNVCPYLRQWTTYAKACHTKVEMWPPQWKTVWTRCTSAI